jgi:hypothetical protein
VGAPTTLPGYGPNTRTVMKVTVSSAPPAARFDVPNTDSDRFGALKAAFAHHADGSGVFEQGQHPLIVGQAAYNTALGTSFVANGWCNSTVNPSAKCDGYARIQEQGGDPFKFDTVDPNAQASAVVDAASTGVDVATYTRQGVLHVAATSGFGKSGKITVATSTGTAVLSYSGVDVQRDSAGQQRELAFTGVRLVSGSGLLATGGVITGPKGQLAIPLEGKGIHDEMNSASFDEYGRMTANMGLEAPGATPLLQNIILYPYVNPSTELLDSSGLPDGVSVTPISSASDGTQIWKITHNGVDTHPIHFHLFDVQVINRVTWDNIIIPPDPNELGWKDTVRISPLEDTLVAVRPIIPRLPFAIPDSRRPLNPMMPVGAKGDLNGAINGQEAGFNNTDTAGAPMATPIVNEVVNNGWEYVYHCHILSHEEMDMMRPVNVHVSWSPPSAPTALTYDQGTLRWTDGTPYSTSPAAWDMHHSEIGFRIERAPVPAKGSPAFEVVGDAIANAESFVDSTANPGTSYVYRVTAWNEGGDTSSNIIQVTAPAKAPTNLVATLLAGPSVQLDWAMPADPTITSVVVEREDGVGVFTEKAVLAADATTWTDTTVVGGLYTYRAYTTNAGGSSAFAGPVSVSIHASTTSLTSVANPSTFGSLATFTATVAGVPPTTPPTGTVTFSVNGVPAQTVTLANGSATFFTSTLAVGSSVITADYSGDPNFVASTGSVTQVVNKASSSVSLASDAPVAPGLGDVTLTANVVPGSATGTVTFTVDRGLPSVVTRTVAMVGGSATWTVSSLVVGTHTVDATYSGDGSYLPSTSPSITQTIVAIPTTVSVTSSQNPSRNGQLVTFNAAVAAASGTATPSGSVTFRITTAGAADTVAVVALGGTGRASFTTGALSIGSHAVTVSYGTTLPWASSVSSTLTQMVDRSASSVLLQSSVNPSVFGQTVTFTADMNSTAATGTVTFVIDGTTSYAATVDSNGRARLALATLAVGNHTVVANYSGSPLYSPSSSATITQTVQKASTAVSLRTSGSPANRGTRVTFTATVTALAPGVGAPTGIIRFTIDGRIYDVAVRQGGIATYWTRLLAVGTHQVTATYMGNANFNVSTRAVISQRIR